MRLTKAQLKQIIREELVAEQTPNNDFLFEAGMSLFGGDDSGGGDGEPGPANAIINQITTGAEKLGELVSDADMGDLRTHVPELETALEKLSELGQDLDYKLAGNAPPTDGGTM